MYVVDDIRDLDDIGMYMDTESGTIWLVVTQPSFQMHMVALICSDLSGQYFSCLDKFDQLPGSLVAVSLRSYYFAFFCQTFDDDGTRNRD